MQRPAHSQHGSSRQGSHAYATAVHLESMRLEERWHRACLAFELLDRLWSDRGKVVNQVAIGIPKEERAIAPWHGGRFLHELAKCFLHASKFLIHILDQELENHAPIGRRLCNGSAKRCCTRLASTPRRRFPRSACKPRLRNLEWGEVAQPRCLVRDTLRFHSPCRYHAAYASHLDMAIKTELDDQRFHSIARVLADPRRFAILQQIASSTVALPCSALAAQREVTRATISHHLKELVEAGLVDAEREGRVMLLTFRRDLWRAYCNRLVAL